MRNEYSNSFKTLSDDFFSFGADQPPQIIIYSAFPNARLKYVCDFIFKQGLKINYSLTDNSEEFKQSPLVQLNYSDIKIQGTETIFPSGLLSETGIRNFLPASEKKEGRTYFFSTPASDYPFDIFSAVFYFISRYEEHFPFDKDIHGRFHIKASLLYKEGTHRMPLIDIWIIEFKEWLLKKRSTLHFPERKFRFLSTIDVDNVYAFKTKPFGRMAGANLKDFLNLNFANISRRFQTRYMSQPDPFDAYGFQMDVSEKTNIPLLYFFLCRNNTAFDRTINPDHPELKELLSTIGRRKVPVGLHPSYFSSQEADLLKKEITLLRKNSGQEVIFSRQHYLRFDIKKTPEDLIRQGVKYDFTMGYSSEVGYRAGTTLPFYYYDFENEKERPLLAIPFVVMDGAYYQYKKMSTSQAENDILQLAADVMKVNGLFTTVFHDRSFSEKQFPGWKQLYVNLHQSLKPA